MGMFSLWKSYVSMTLKEAALTKNSENTFLWINIVYQGDKIQDIMFILFSISFKQMITDLECCVDKKVRQFING